MDPAQQTEHIVLTLDFDPENQAIAVSGPIHNRMLCYGLLKLAEKAIDENYSKNVRPRIQPAGINGERFRR